VSSFPQPRHMKFYITLTVLLVLGISASAQIAGAENGLSVNPPNNSVQLGGTLNKSTTIDQNGFDFHLKSGSSPIFTTLANGNIGIGTFTPGAKLSFIDCDQTTDPVGLTWYNGGPTAYGIHRTAGPWTAPNYQQLRISFNTGIILDPGTSYGKSYVEVAGNGMRIPTGNLGIGTTSPGSLLSLGGTTNNSKLAIWEMNINGQYARAGLGMMPGQFRLFVPGPDNRFSFLSDEPGTTEIMTINGTGNVGIGTTNPGTASLAIEKSNNDGGATIAPMISIKNTSTSLPAGSGYNQAGVNYYSGNNAVLGQVVSNYGVGGGAPWNSGSGLYITTRTEHPIIFATGASTTERARILANGNFLLGKTNDNSAKFQLSGHGSFIGTTDYGTALWLGDNLQNYVAGIKTYGDGSGANRYTVFGHNMVEPGTLYNQTKQGGGIYLDDRNGILPIRFMVRAAGSSGSAFAGGVTATGNLVLGSPTDNGNRLQVDGKVWASGLILPYGAGAGKVLTSDADGNATWQTATGGSTTSWAFGGNAVAASSSLGTTSNYDLPIITNNIERMRVTANGNVGIGTTTPHSKLEVGTSAADDATPYQPTIWDTYSARFNNGNVSIFSSGNTSTVGDSYQLNFYARYYSYGQSYVTNKSAYIKGTSINDNLYGAGGQWAGRGTLVLGSSNTNYNNNTFEDVPTMYLTNAKVGIGEASPSARLHIKTSTADASASDFQLVDNAGGSILSVRNDQKFTLGSGTQNTELVISGTGYYSGIYSPAFGPTSTNIISFKNAAGDARMTFDMSNGGDGKLGIGITAPTEKLDVNGNIKATGFILPTGAAAGKVLTSDASGNASWQTATGGSTNNWAFGGNAVPASSTFGTTSNYDLPIVTNNTERMRIGANGNVGIGTTNINNTGYKLFVEGNIRTRKVRVDQDTWADYVFDSNYRLRPLNEVEQYIQQEKHLPDVPAAEEVKKEGLDLGNNQAVLLKKIEELTLYVIQQQKQLEAQQQKIEMLEKKVNGNK